MSPEKQRIAIAEACGWTPYKSRKFVPHPRGRGHMECDADHPQGYPSNMPDYLNDLNAIHEAVATLNDKDNIINDEDGHETQMDRFVWMLELIVERDCAEEWVYQNCINATAAQRAEAFLKTLGKWEDGK